MGILDDLKIMIKNVADKTPDLTKQTWEKVKDTGEEGLGFGKNIINEISIRTTDITNLVKLKQELNQNTRMLDDKYTELGKVAFTFLRFSTAKEMVNFEEAEELLNNISNLRDDTQRKKEKFEELKNQYAFSNNVISNFADELSKSGHVMDQTIVGPKSNVVGNKMKEIQLPKQALITSVQRENELIIPDGNTVFFAGDKVTVMGAEDDVQKIIKRFSDH